MLIPLHPTAPRGVTLPAPGRVALVGAGPGDPGLITRRGLDLLRSADVVLYDRLVAPALLEEIPDGARRVYVGKARGSHAASQEEINALLVRHARTGALVVRLKGGDPFVFGRGGEEALALREAGVAFEVVPGISSVVGVPAYAGIPVTHRGISSSVSITTGHEGLPPGPAWHLLIQQGGTLVVLMGLRALPGIARRLLAEGVAPTTPVAVLADGTTPHQQVVVGSLEDIAGRAAHLAPPATIVVGDVVRLHHALDWFAPSRPALAHSA